MKSNIKRAGYLSVGAGIIVSIFATVEIASGVTNVVVDTELKLLASDATNNAHFGNAVAIDSGTAAVWSLDPQVGLTPTFASVYIYNHEGSNWVQRQKLQPIGGTLPSGVATNFSETVALDGNLLIVGAPAQSPEANPAYIFARLGSNWVQQAVIDRGLQNNDLFGESVDISGSTVVIGAPNYLSNIVAEGAAFVYVQQGTNWVRQAVLTAPDAIVQEELGLSVAISGDTILAGALDFHFSGAVYAFVRSGTNWSLQQKFMASDATDLARFGASVDLEGDVAVVGAPRTTVQGNSNAGEAYIFVRNGSTWTQQQQLVPSNIVPGALFGSSVAIRGNRVIIGAPGQSVNGNANAGASYIFEQIGGSWIQVQELVSSDASANDQFGWSVAAGDQAFLVGAPLNDQGGLDAGAAYIFSRTEPAVVTRVTATPSVLFPPNHKLIPVTVSVEADSNDLSCKIVSISSSEPVTGDGTGKKSPDWIITGDLTALLRAERSGKDKAGRVYTITVECSDLAGNTPRTNVLVTVPHDRR